MPADEPPAIDPASPRTSVVIATRNRRTRLIRTLEHLSRLPEEPPVIVVDNGSTDGSPDAVRRMLPAATVIALGTNRGAAARNVGAAAAVTPYVAFADDDSWWAPGSLSRAADLLDDHDRLALIAARILVGDDQRLDPVSAAMAASPLPAPTWLPGPAVLGFLACGAVVRRDAFLDAGGFSELLFFFGEERLLAIDLAAAGWHLAYVTEVIAHHHPEQKGPTADRRRRQLRNDLLTDLLRRPARRAIGHTLRLVVGAWTDPAARRALVEVGARLPAALAERRPVPAAVEQRLALLADGHPS